MVTVPKAEQLRLSPQLMPALLTLLALLAGLVTGVLLLLSGLLAAALLLTRLLAWILALLAGVLVRIVLVAHDGISLVERRTNFGDRFWLQRNSCSCVVIFWQCKHRGRRHHVAPVPVAAPGSRC